MTPPPPPVKSASSFNNLFRSFWKRDTKKKNGTNTFRKTIYISPIKTALSVMDQDEKSLTTVIETGNENNLDKTYNANNVIDTRNNDIQHFVGMHQETQNEKSDELDNCDYLDGSVMPLNMIASNQLQIQSLQNMKSLPSQVLDNTELNDSAYLRTTKLIDENQFLNQNIIDDTQHQPSSTGKEYSNRSKRARQWLDINSVNNSTPSHEEKRRKSSHFQSKELDFTLKNSSWIQPELNSPPQQRENNKNKRKLEEHDVEVPSHSVSDPNNVSIEKHTESSSNHSINLPSNPTPNLHSIYMENKVNIQKSEKIKRVSTANDMLKEISPELQHSLLRTQVLKICLPLLPISNSQQNQVNSTSYSVDSKQYRQSKKDARESIARRGSILLNYLSMNKLQLDIGKQDSQSSILHISPEKLNVGEEADTWNKQRNVIGRYLRFQSKFGEEDYHIICLLLTQPPIDLSLSIVSLIFDDLSEHLSDFHHFMNFINTLHGFIHSSYSQGIELFPLLYLLHNLVFKSYANSEVESRSARVPYHRPNFIDPFTINLGVAPSPNPLLSIIFQTSFVNFILNIIEYNTFATGNSKAMTFHNTHDRNRVGKFPTYQQHDETIHTSIVSNSGKQRLRPLSIGPDVDKTRLLKLFSGPHSARNSKTNTSYYDDIKQDTQTSTQNVSKIPTLRLPKPHLEENSSQLNPSALSIDTLRSTINSLRSKRKENSSSFERSDFDFGSDSAYSSNSLSLLQSIGATLGETHIASELTHLISVRRQMELRHASHKSQSFHDWNNRPTPSQFPSEQVTLLNQITNPRKQLLPTQILQTLLNCNIPLYHLSLFLSLRILFLCSKNAKSRRSSQQTINILTSHLFAISLPPQNIFQSESGRIITSLLSLFSDDVESRYTNILKSSITKTKYSVPKKPISLTANPKLDHFLWRWKNSVTHVLNRKDFHKLNHYLYFLMEYLESSRSRIQASQVCTVCLDLLITIQNACQVKSFNEYPISCTVSFLLRVFRFIITCPDRNGLILEFCYLNFIANNSTWKWIKKYSHWILSFKSEDDWLNSQRETGIPISWSAAQCSVIQYYQSLIDLLKSYFETGIQKIDHQLCSSRLEFLLHPVKGLLLHLLTQKDRFKKEHSNLQQEILLLIALIFTQGKIFIDVDSYASTYIRFHFMNLVELYTNNDFSSETCSLCSLHLEILLALSRNKTSSIADQFYSLQVVQFLSKEIDFESKLHENAESRPFSSSNEVGEKNCNENELFHAEDELDSQLDTITEASTDTDLTSVSEHSIQEFNVPGLSLNQIAQEADQLDEVGFVNIPQLKTLPHDKIPSSRSTKSITHNGEGTPRIIPSVPISSGYSTENLEPGFVIHQARNPTVEDTDSSSEEEDMRFSIPKRQISTKDSKSCRSSIVSTSSVSISLLNMNIPPESRKNSGGTIESISEMSDSEMTNSEMSECTTEDDLSSEEESNSSMGSIEPSEEEFMIPKLGLKVSLLNDAHTEKKFVEHDGKSNSKVEPSILICEDLTMFDEGQELILFEKNFSQRSNTSYNGHYFDKNNTSIDKRRKIYHDLNLHSSFICLLLNLLLTDYETLDSRYTSQHPHLSGMPNILYMLYHHINDENNLAAMDILRKKIINLDSVGTQILFRVLCKKSFDAALYSNIVRRIGSGGFANVWEVKLDNHLKGCFQTNTMAVKLIKLPTSPHDRCVWHDSFNEIFIMENYSNSPYICKMYDFGVDDSNLYIVMEKYDCSLRNWREKQVYSVNENLPIYMQIFQKILHGVQCLAENKINHFDLKCDNIFLKKNPEVTEEEFLNQKSTLLNFNIVIGDFGESHIYGKLEDSHTKVHRGTSCVKSPEMLKIEMMSTSSKFYDRRKKVGAGRSSDIWSLGCLFFELLSGDYLFDATDFGQFFELLTNPQLTLIPQSAYQKIDYHPLMHDILMYFLVRDPNRRPNIENVIERFPYWMNPIPPLEKLRSRYIELNQQQDEAVDLNQKKFINTIEVENSSHINDKTSSSRSISSRFHRMSSHNLGLHGLLSARDFSILLDFESVLNNRIRLSTEEKVNDKNVLYQLGITHIIYCVQTQEDASLKTFLEENYFLLVLEQISLNDENLDAMYNGALQFILQALKSNGHILIFGSSKNISRCIILLLLSFVEIYGLSTFEAYVTIRSKLPITLPSNIVSNYLGMLGETSSAWQRIEKFSQIWPFSMNVHKELHTHSSKRLYRCLCGKCIYGFDQIYLLDGQPVMLKESNLSDETSPLKSYPQFIGDMQSLYSRNDFLKHDCLEMAYIALESNLIRIGDRRNYRILEESNTVLTLWLVYACNSCGYVTYCVRRNSRKSGIMHSTNYLTSNERERQRAQELGHVAIHCGYPLNIQSSTFDLRKESILTPNRLKMTNK